MITLRMCAICLLLAGCSLTPKPEEMVVDTFCISAKKRTWSINDSPESIHDAEVWNSTIDRRCGGKVS